MSANNWITATRSRLGSRCAHGIERRTAKQICEQLYYQMIEDRLDESLPEWRREMYSIWDDGRWENDYWIPD